MDTLIIPLMRSSIVLAIVLCTNVVRAEPDRERTQAAMEDYFSGEKRGGLLLVGMGAGGLTAGGLLYLRGDSDVAKGMSYPLLGFGLAHAAAGIFVYVASDRRIEKFSKNIATDPQAFTTAERTRMKGVSTTFTALKVVEVVLIAGGLTTAYFAHRSGRKTLEGVGYGVAIEAGLTLGFDIIAGRRAYDYRDELTAVDTPSGTALMLTHGGSF
jgi:hypothetical protein